MKNKKVFGAFLLAFSMLFAFTVKAQVASEFKIPDELLKSSEMESGNAIKIATVNIYDAKIVNQEGNAFNISFDISNGDDIQSQILYSVKLVKEDGKTLVDHKVFDEVVSLRSNEEIKKEIKYVAPENLKGNYLLILESRNNSGLVFYSAPLEKVTLNGSGEYMELSNCYLTVQGDKENKYTLSQGVDVAKDETLVAHCDVKNNFASSMTIVPFFENHYRTIFGKSTVSSLDKRELKSGDNVNQEFVIPRDKKPQAYDAVLKLKSADGKIVSTEAVFHYVSKGLSATVENVLFDKDFYDAGDEANVSFLWFSSADGFPGSRQGGTSFKSGKLNIAITNDSGEICSENLSRDITRKDEGVPMKLSLKVNKPCANPTVQTSIADSNGNVLALENYSIKSSNLPDYLKSKEVKKDDNLKRILAALIVLLIVIVIIIVLYVKKRKNLVALFVLVLALSFFNINGAKADTFINRISTGGPDDYVDVQYSVSMNKKVYNPGEQINVSGTVNYSLCSNGSTLNTTNKLIATVNNTSKTIIDNIETYDTVNSSATFLAPMTGGIYSATFDTVSKYSGIYTGYKTYTITYTVLAIPGTCGTAASKSYIVTDFDKLTAADLCSAGTLSNKAPTATGWSWQCVGNTTTSDCSALRRDPVNGKASTTVNNITFREEAFLPKLLYGDPNGNGSMDAATGDTSQCTVVGSSSYGTDLCMMVRYILGVSGATCPLASCDLNDDGKVSATDLQLRINISTKGSPTRVCDAGVQNNLKQTADGWTWTCDGLYGGTSESGKAMLPPIAAGQCDSTVNGKNLPQTQLDALKIWGDANLDGALDHLDANPIVNTILGFTNTTCTLGNCDLNADGKISITDLAKSINIAIAKVGFPTKLCASGYQTNTVMTAGVGLTWDCLGTRIGLANANCGAGIGSPATLTVSPPSDNLTITSTDGYINCTSTGGTCSYVYGVGSTVNLKAVVTSGNHFVSWSDACTGTDPNTCSVLVDIDKSVSAQSAVDQVCGDGMKQGSEQCDDGANNGPCPSTCTTSCTTATCTTTATGTSWREVNP